MQRSISSQAASGLNRVASVAKPRRSNSFTLQSFFFLLGPLFWSRMCTNLCCKETLFTVCLCVLQTKVHGVHGATLPSTHRTSQPRICVQGSTSQPCHLRRVHRRTFVLGASDDLVNTLQSQHAADGHQGIPGVPVVDVAIHVALDFRHVLASWPVAARRSSFEASPVLGARIGAL